MRRRPSAASPNPTKPIEIDTNPWSLAVKERETRLVLTGKGDLPGLMIDGDGRFSGIVNARSMDGERKQRQLLGAGPGGRTGNSSFQSPCCKPYPSGLFGGQVGN